MWFKSSDERLIDVSGCSLQLKFDGNGKWGDQAIILGGSVERALFTDRHNRRYIETELTMRDVWQALEQMLQEGLNVIAENDEKVLSRAQAIVEARTVQTDHMVEIPSDDFSMTVHTAHGPVKGTFVADPLINAETDSGDDGS